VRRTGAIIKRTALAFYDDQMTHHAAALTYYALMSLFPALLLAVSILGLVGQYPATYDAILGYLRDVVPPSALVPLDTSLRTALQQKGTAATTLAISVVVTLYGTTGALEAARRALNVVFEADAGRRFVARKAVDIVSTVVLMALVLLSLVLVFVGGQFAEDLLGFLGLGETVVRIWDLARWPGAVAVAMLVFSFIYYVTPDVRQRSFRWVTPGAVAGVMLWLLASAGFSIYVGQVADVGALYGAFAGAIVLVAWLWLTNVALLFGAELNAEIEREQELAEGVPEHETLDLPNRCEASQRRTPARWVGWDPAEATGSQTAAKPRATPGQEPIRVGAWRRRPVVRTTNTTPPLSSSAIAAPPTASPSAKPSSAGRAAGADVCPTGPICVWIGSTPIDSVRAGA
jgi:membrane protein